MHDTSLVVSIWKNSAVIFRLLYISSNGNNNNHCLTNTTVIFIPHQSMQEPNYHVPRPFARHFDASVCNLFPDVDKKIFKVLDVAAGTGLLGLELNKLGYTNIDALDMSQEMLNRAMMKNVYNKLICAAMTDQRINGIETAEYDALTCSSAVCTSHVRPSAFEEMVKIVKPGMRDMENISLSYSFRFFPAFVNTRSTIP